MTHQARRLEIREQLRKNQIENILSQRRNELLLNPIENSIVNQNDYWIRRLTLQTYTEEGIMKLRNQGWLEKLYEYLQPKYHRTIIQRYAATSLCNLLIFPTQKPDEKLTHLFLNSLCNIEIQVVKKTIGMIYNIICDHQDWKKELYDKEDILQILPRLFHVQLREDFLNQLVNFIAKFTQKAPKCGKLINLATQLTLIFQKQHKNSLFIYQKVIYSLNNICKSNLQIFSIVLSSSVLQTIIKLPNIYLQQKLASNVLSLLYIGREKIKSKMFNSIFFPFIKTLIKRCSEYIKLIAYNVLYCYIEAVKLKCQQLWKDQICQQQMKIQLEQGRNQAIVCEILHIFCILLLNLKLTQDQEIKLVQLIQVSAEKYCRDVQTLGIVEESLIRYRESRVNDNQIDFI